MAVFSESLQFFQAANPPNNPNRVITADALKTRATLDGPSVAWVVDVGAWVGFTTFPLGFGPVKFITIQLDLSAFSFV